MALAIRRAPCDEPRLGAWMASAFSFPSAPAAWVNVAPTMRASAHAVRAETVNVALHARTTCRYRSGSSSFLFAISYEKECATTSFPSAALLR